MLDRSTAPLVEDSTCGSVTVSVAVDSSLVASVSVCTCVTISLSSGLPVAISLSDESVPNTGASVALDCGVVCTSSSSSHSKCGQHLSGEKMGLQLGM